MRLLKRALLIFFFFFPVGSYAAEASVKKERPFGTPVLQRSSKTLIKRKTLIHRCLVWWTLVSILKPTDPRCFVCCACLLRCISLAKIALMFWGISLPSGPSGERTPFRFLECDVQGGDVNQIKDADAALAWMFSQFPMVTGNSGMFPNQTVSLSWPPNMEAQDLFPWISSTYTFPTGTKVDVPCFALDKVVDIKRAECPDSFVNPHDPNYDRPCVKVLHGSTRCLHP